MPLRPPSVGSGRVTVTSALYVFVLGASIAALAFVIYGFATAP